MTLGIGNKSKCILGTVFFSVILILNPLAAFATGESSTPTNGECDNPNVKHEPIPGGSDSHDAGAGNIVTGLCIKDGSGAFAEEACGNGDQHSCLLTAPGNYPVGIGNCYQVMGIGTQVATVSENFGGSSGGFNCGELSHVEYFIDFNGKVGGHGGIPNKTALLVTGATLNASWMIPLLISAVGIGIFVFTYKNE